MLAHSRPGRALIAVVVLAVALATVGLAGPAGPAGSATGAVDPSITMFEVAGDDPNPGGVALGPDGNMWFTELWANAIVEVEPDGTMTPHVLDAFYGEPNFITAGPDGALWFTLFPGDDDPSNGIGRITTDGDVTIYPFAEPFGPQEIVVGPDGDLWFVESTGSHAAVATFSVDDPADVTRYELPDQASGPIGITTGPDGALWFTEELGDRIGRITTDGDLTEFDVPGTDASPLFISSGPDGALWFTEYGGNRVGRITTSGAITECPPLAGGPTLPTKITRDVDGELWFLESGSIDVEPPPADPQASALVHLATDCTTSRYDLPDGAAAVPWYLAAGAGRTLWFSQFEPAAIGRVELPVPTPTTSTTGPPTTTTSPTITPVASPVRTAPAFTG